MKVLTPKQKLFFFLTNSDDVSIASIEKALGKSNGYLKNTENYSFDIVSKLTKMFPDLNMNWVFGEEKNMLKTKTSPNSKEKEDGKKIEVDADSIMSLLEVIRNKQDDLLISFGKIQGPLSLSGAKQQGELVDSDVAALIAKERARIAAGKRGARNEPVKQKVSGKKS